MLYKRNYMAFNIHFDFYEIQYVYPKGQSSHCLLIQTKSQQKAEQLRCPALITRGGRLKSSFVPWELSLPTKVAHGYGQHAHMIQGN